MKRILENFNSKIDFEKFKKDKAEEILKEKLLIEYLKNNNFTKEDVYKDPFIFNDTLNSLKSLINHDFNKELDGYIIGVKKEGEFYYPYRQASLELKKYLEKTRHLKNYIVNHFENLYDLNFDDLSIENESVSYINLYHYFKEFDYKKTKKGLYICGNLGIGKTFLMAAFLNSLAKQGYKIAFIKLSEFISKYKNIELLTDKIELINNIKTVDILALDDLGSEYITSFVKDEILMPILDYRMNSKLLTFFTSNYNFKQLENIYVDSNNKSDQVNAKRIIERIQTLAKLFNLESKNKRHD